MQKKLYVILVTLVLVFSLMIVSNQGVENTTLEESSEIEKSPEKENEEERNSYLEERENMIEGSYWNSEREYDEGSGDSDEKISSEIVSREIPDRELEYNESDPIRIDSDEEFENKSMERNWSGDGSEEDPYVIEGLEIDGQGFGYGIFIGNVTDHFEIRESHLHNASEGTGRYFSNRGIHIYNTFNGQVINNTFENNTQGAIYLYESSGNSLEDNIIESDEGQDILLEGSEDNELVNNLIYKEDPPSETLSSDEDIEYSEDRVLVHLETPDTERVDRHGEETALKLRSDEISSKIDGMTSRVFTVFDMVEIELDSGLDVDRAVDTLSEMDEVITAEPDYHMEFFQNIPDDPGYDSLWGMPMIDAPEAWEMTTGSEEVVVAVVDTGIDHDHPDLEDNMWTSDEGHHGYNAVNDSYDPMDDHGHGTHVAGTIGAVGDNDEGVVGVNWNVSLMGIKIGGAEGIAMSDAVAGLEYVLEQRLEGENVIASSNSWGGTQYSEILHEAIKQHQEAGISFVAAAGNARADADETPFYPANYDLSNVISVAATNEEDELARFSNYGERSVHVGAPGVDINSTLPGEEYGFASGTSMAAPHVSGLLALLRSHRPDYDHNQLKNAVLSSAESYERFEDIMLTEGRINAHQALELQPDPEDVNIWVHRPTSHLEWGEKTPVTVSLNDGVDPVLGANVSVEFSSGEDTIYLEDDGSGGDQPNDGYYTGGWTPTSSGEIELTITAVLEDERELEENITVQVHGDSGIVLMDSEYNLLRDNLVSENQYGISLYSSDSNELDGNHLEGNDEAGIRLYESTDNQLSDQMISRNQFGIWFYNAYDNYVSNNELTENDMGVMLQFSQENLFAENHFSENWYAFIIENSEHNSLIENEMLDSRFMGVGIAFSNDNVVQGNELEEQTNGIFLIESKDNLVVDNTLTRIDEGILMSMSENEEIRDNDLYTSSLGIYLEGTERITLLENSMSGGGIYLMGTSLSNWNTHTIETSNTVNGGPVRYWKNQTGGTISEGSGQIILANCNDVTVEQQDIGGGSAPIMLGFSSDNTIKDNIIGISNWEGLTLIESHGNVIEDNELLDNEHPGLFLFSSDDNSVRENEISRNGYGLVIFESMENTMTENLISNNTQRGIWVTNSDDNLIYRNKIIENTAQAMDDGDNDWDAGDPAEGGEGGNYWSDYDGEDRSDGVGVDSYIISGGRNTDNYPWLNPDMKLSDFFDVEIVGYDNTVEQNEEVIIDYEVENIGGQEGEQDLEFLLDGEIVDTDTLEISPDVNETGQFIWTADEDLGTYNLTVGSEDDQETVQVEVLEGPLFEVSLTVEEDQIRVGEELTVNYTIENIGDMEGEQEIEFHVNEGSVEIETITLDPEDFYEGTFTWEPEEEGTFELTVESEDDSSSLEVTAEEEPPLIETPGFTFAILSIAFAVALVIYHRKKNSR